MNMLELLEHSFQMESESTPGISRLQFLADFIFNFTTYDDEVSELFATKALEVCIAINTEKTFDYIVDPENYRWFLLMINMPFFKRRLEWGGSIRGAWWVYEPQTLESLGLWIGDEQMLKGEFSRDSWIQFIESVATFSKIDAEKTK